MNWSRSTVDGVAPVARERGARVAHRVEPELVPASRMRAAPTRGSWWTRTQALPALVAADVVRVVAVPVGGSVGVSTAQGSAGAGVGNDGRWACRGVVV